MIGAAKRSLQSLYGVKVVCHYYQPPLTCSIYIGSIFIYTLYYAFSLMFPTKYKQLLKFLCRFKISFMMLPPYYVPRSKVTSPQSRQLLFSVVIITVVLLWVMVIIFMLYCCLFSINIYWPDEHVSSKYALLFICTVYIYYASELYVYFNIATNQ